MCMTLSSFSPEFCREWRKAPTTKGERLEPALGLGGQLHAYLQPDHDERVPLRRAGCAGLQHSTVRHPEGIPATYGIQGVPGGTALGGLPDISISELASLGASGYNPVSHSTPNWEIDEVVTKIHGNHTFNIGYQLTDIPAICGADRRYGTAYIQWSILGYHNEGHRLYGDRGCATGSVGIVFARPWLRRRRPKTGRALHGELY